MRKVTILRGPSGVGKSTWAKSSHPEARILSTDDLFLNEAGEYEWDVTKLSEYHWTTLSRFIRAVRHRVPHVIVDNTNCSLWEIAPYIEASELASYRVEVLAWIPETVAELKVVAERSGHGVPPGRTCEKAVFFEPHPLDERMPIDGC